MDSFANKETLAQPWLCLMGAALAHVSAEFLQSIRREAPWIKLCFVNPGTAACPQPLDRNMTRPSECSLQRVATSLLADGVVSTLTGEGEFTVAMPTPPLRPLAPLWVAAVVRSIEASPRLYEEAWAFVFARSVHDALTAA